MGQNARSKRPIPWRRQRRALHSGRTKPLSVQNRTPAVKMTRSRLTECLGSELSLELGRVGVVLVMISYPMLAFVFSVTGTLRVHAARG